jgi:Pyrimidine dimer DNA glycosylase
MRMWNIDPACMCDYHLMGEHAELHMFVGSIRKGISMKGYIEGGYLEIHHIKSRHRAVANELVLRGYKHKSPLPPFPATVAGSINVLDNVTELRRRCEFCEDKLISYKYIEDSLW